MPVALITHPDCFDHDTGPHHPERPARLRAVLAALEQPEFQPLLREAAPEAPEAAIRGVHQDAYVDAMFALAPASDEKIHLDADTIASEGTLRAALRAAGGAMRGVDAVQEGWARCAFVATRPPGHHAEPDRAMGFCLFGNAAIAANHARAHGLRRIAVVDFDVHHGNGTQAMFENDPDLFYASSHQFPCYPGTGGPSETGIAGNIVNAILPPESGSAEFRAAWRDILIPALDRFAPELLIISAGFDAHRADPLAQLNVETEDFAWLTTALMEVADRHCGGRIVSLLEGGYDLAALAAGTAAHVRALMRI
ncbi:MULTISPECIES: histone deacetylase family protein [Acidiphilium]|uniref:Acetoin utilization deacetylase AcuC n=1 Tax=Acidiphilium rubrum TaxID=526 RepID=A0A8G2FGY8_ACIRU|nr:MULTISPECIES: histone deacetylase family protein [Acidiphilium]MBW4034294.1 histone deacetylase family protein [Pseudomonadota bacterium]SIR15800.1 Acetoin utilization deacetylase AcuC [Acidiphilium rubrum]